MLILLYFFKEGKPWGLISQGYFYNEYDTFYLFEDHTTSDHNRHRPRDSLTYYDPFVLIEFKSQSP